MEKPSWFTKLPSDVHKKVTWNNREWNWCGKVTGGKYEAFVIHKPLECKGLKRTGPNPKSKQKKTKVKVEEAVTEEKHDMDMTPYDDGFIL